MLYAQLWRKILGSERIIKLVHPLRSESTYRNVFSVIVRLNRYLEPADRIRLYDDIPLDELQLHVPELVKKVNIVARAHSCAIHHHNYTVYAGKREHVQRLISLEPPDDLPF